MKRKYTVPEMEITQFEMKDVITESDGTEIVPARIGEGGGF